jgi:hypothetical protein
VNKAEALDRQGVLLAGRQLRLPESCGKAVLWQIDPTRGAAILSARGSERGSNATEGTPASGQQDLLRSRLDQIVDAKHSLVKLAVSVDGSFLEQRFGARYTDRPAQGSSQIRRA